MPNPIHFYKKILLHVILAPIKAPLLDKVERNLCAKIIFIIYAAFMAGHRY